MTIGDRRLQGLYPMQTLAAIVDEELRAERAVH